jgi:hypothetical protein
LTGADHAQMLFGRAICDKEPSVRAEGEGCLNVTKKGRFVLPQHRRHEDMSAGHLQVKDENNVDSLHDGINEKTSTNCKLTVLSLSNIRTDATCQVIMSRKGE